MFFLSLIQYAVLAWQLSFPVFDVAPRPGGADDIVGRRAIGWAGAMLPVEAPLFGPFTCICALSYLRPEEWAWVKARIKAITSRPDARPGSAVPG